MLLETNRQVESDIYCVILPRQTGTEVLLSRADGRFALPSVDVPRWQRVAESLTSAVEKECGCDAICLFTPDVTLATGDAKRIRYQVMQCCDRLENHNNRTQWVPVSLLSQHAFADPTECAAIQQSLAQRDEYGRGSTPGPFVKPGWFNELRLWVDEVIAPLGLHLKGGCRQLNAAPSFSLIRLESSGPAVWFKAVGEPNLREFPITLALAQLFPNYTPSILATRPEWNGWLALELEGGSLDECQSTEEWRAAATALAKLQIDSLGKHAQLLNVGARDLRTSSLSGVLQPFLDVVGQLMEQQSKTPPVVLTRKDLQLLGEHIQDALSLIDEIGIPEALGHLDLNPGNIFVAANECRFLDWAEAYIGHPFFTFEYLLEHFRRRFGTNPTLEAQFTAAYAEPWRRLLSSDEASQALSLAPLLAAFACAAGNDVWSDPEKRQRPNVAGYLRSLTRRMKREADEWIARRARCLN